MIPKRDELITDGTRLCMLYYKYELTEAFCKNTDFFAIENMTKIKKISEEEAIVIYVHPFSKDQVNNPQEIFNLSVVNNNWSPEKNITVYSSEGKITFEFINDFKSSPKIKTLSPGEIHAVTICKLTDKNIPTRIVTFNTEFFLIANKTKRISSEDAILYYIDPRATDHALNPNEIFPTISEVSRKENVVRYKTATDTIFEYSLEEGRRPAVSLIQEGNKQRQKQSGHKL